MSEVYKKQTIPDKFAKCLTKIQEQEGKIKLKKILITYTFEIWESLRF